jgi:hypothetical protein
MKKKFIELNVDFIGGQDSLTKEEELAISDFIRKDKEERRLRDLQKNKRMKKATLLPA